MVFAIAVGASDIRSHPLAYFGQWANFHIAYLDQWPSGTSHYWTLALQVQFYLLWPLVVLLVPQRLLAAAMVACVALAPASRAVIEWWFPAIRHSEAITSTAMDYFGCGALLALAMSRGMLPGDKRLRTAAWIAFAGYATLYTIHEITGPVHGLRYFQQTLVSVAFAGLISSTLAGFSGRLGTILEHPLVQHRAPAGPTHRPLELWVLPISYAGAVVAGMGAAMVMGSGPP